MEKQNENLEPQNADNQDKFILDISSATPLTLMELNNIKLDAKHTVLTPEYLENLEKGKITDKQTK